MKRWEVRWGWLYRWQFTGKLEIQMETMTALVSAVRSPVVASLADGSFDDCYIYEGVRLDTDDPDKLIPFVDQLLFFLRVQRYKTRPVTIRECSGIAEIQWSGRKPKAFRNRLLLVISAGEHVDCFQVAAA
jgi:hypothetical protein